MAKNWRYFVFLIWISYLIISGIILFTRGFLLTRNSFTDSTKCNVNPNISSPIDCSKSTCNGSNTCSETQSKVILMIIDALRFDFTEFNDEIDDPLPYQNKMPVVMDMLKKHPERTRLFKFVADPPTTTMQRLKALTTGSLPTFIDAGSNFATPELNEDNIIDQMLLNNRTTVFMGDDTWSKLYPRRFKRAWNFPSFNVWDLDTVDQGVQDNIYTEMEKQDWQLLIAHFLGVDHAGHRYGPNHDEMARKLKEMNEVIKNVIHKMDDKTMLFVIGDHGMTKNGDHGGESDLETNAAMFIYSSHFLNKFNPTDSVKQIDLIPTLATILGIAIPFSNLGSLIVNALPITKSDVPIWKSNLVAVYNNIEQTTHYINTYSKRSDLFKKDEIEIINNKYKYLKEKIKEVKNEVDFENVYFESKEFLEMIRNMCENVWIQFDSYAMSRGLLLSFLTLFFTYLIIDGIPSKKISKIMMGSFIFCCYFACFIVGAITILCYYFSFIDNIELNLLFSTGMISVVMLAILVIQNWDDIASNWYECVKIRSWLDTITRVILLLIVCMLFSNSYILEEANVLAYLLLSILIVVIYNSNNKHTIKSRGMNVKIKWNTVKMKLIVMGIAIGILIRFSMYYWRCREEQVWCDFNLYFTKTTNTTNCIITLICLAFFATVTRIWLRSCGNLVGFSPTVTFTRYAPSVIVVCIGGFWILNRLPKETKNRIITPYQTDVLAWIVYSLISSSILCSVIQPLCVYVLPKRKETISVYGQENIIPQLFNQVKKSFLDKKVGTNDTPVVCGLATVYSALYVIISVFLCLLIALLHGNVLAPSSVIMYFTIAIVLAILSISQYERSSNISKMFSVPNSSILCWVLLSLYFFYGTGHQPTFPAIQWEAAFVGTGGHFIHNAIPATLIGFNTFCSFIVMGLLLPLLIIAPFTLYVMFPTLANKNDKDMSKGELVIYENDDDMYDSLLNVSCKYIMCHGIRVFACMLAATIHCRHLMVWNIFAPKLIFEALGIIVTLPCVCLGYLLFIRINYRVDKLITTLDKQNR